MIVRDCLRLRNFRKVCVAALEPGLMLNRPLDELTYLRRHWTIQKSMGTACLCRRRKHDWTAVLTH